MTRMRIALVVVGAVALGAALSVPAADYYYKSSWGAGCARCHEISPKVDVWRTSSHRNVNCVDCHSSSLQTSLHRVKTHFSGEIPTEIRLQANDVFAVQERCASCHQKEAAEWKAGAHSTTYAKIFTNTEHNSKRLLIDDCLRCHGAHLKGSIGTLVQPIDTKGPWKLADASLANRPVIPCLSCHAVHREGTPRAHGKSDEETASAHPAFFDRRTRMGIAVDALPLPAIYEGERLVASSEDQRQALCYQCHAPRASGQRGSGDDRTPVGVHEGISCADCHQGHNVSARAACATCHPAISNCGLDQTKMNTTYADRKNGHDIHSLKCTTCHAKGVPKARK